MGLVEINKTANSLYQKYNNPCVEKVEKAWLIYHLFIKWNKTWLKFVQLNKSEFPTQNLNKGAIRPHVALTTNKHYEGNAPKL